MSRLSTVSYHINDSSSNVNRGRTLLFFAYKTLLIDILHILSPSVFFILAM